MLRHAIPWKSCHFSLGTKSYAKCEDQTGNKWASCPTSSPRKTEDDWSWNELELG